MKKYSFYLSLFIILSVTQISFGQGVDKPLYQIVTHRAGTYLGTINIELFPLIAPKATRNFDSLVIDNFFDSTAFHRVVPGFVIQGGDPNSVSGPINTWGYGQPWQLNIPAEFSVVRHARGMIGAARDADTNSANSQFYICVANAFSLDGQYTVFGRVTQGMDIVDTIVSSPRDINDVPLQKIEMFVTNIGVNDTVPDVPTIISPSDNALGVLNGNNFQWSSVSGGVLYSIEISTDTLFNNIVFGRNTGTNNTAVSFLVSDSTYYWHVKSNNGGHESDYSNFNTFTTASAAQLLDPVNNALNVPINPTMQWTAVPNVGSYRLQVSTSPGFTTPTLVLNQGGITGTSRQVNLQPNTLYYWRVSYAAVGGQGFYSNVFSFTTGTSVGVDDEINPGVTNIFPNPVHDILTVNFSVPSPVEIEISLANILGEIIYSTKKELSEKHNTFDINVSQFSRGSYLLIIKTKEGETYHKVEII